MSESNEFLTFRIHYTIKMNHPVDLDKDYISSGGYEMIMSGRHVQFGNHIFSYKDMDETEGPCYWDCPKNILNLLTNGEMLADISVGISEKSTC